MSSSQTASEADRGKVEASTSNEVSSAAPPSTVQPSRGVPAKRRRVDARPASKAAASTAIPKMPNGADMAMNAENLPPLPALDPDMAHLPYAENKVACQHGSKTHPPELMTGRKTQQRQELVGDSVAKVFVMHWIVNCHSGITARDAALFSAILLSNALFSRLARAYGMEDKIVVQNPGAVSTMSPDEKMSPKRLANAYEAYLGLVFRDVMIGRRPWTGLWDYFSALLTPQVFPDLESQLQHAIKADLGGRAMQQKHSSAEEAYPLVPSATNEPILPAEEVSFRKLPTEPQHPMNAASQTACEASNVSRVDGLPVLPLPCRQTMLRKTQQDVECHSKADVGTLLLGPEESSSELPITTGASQPRDPAIATGNTFTTCSVGVDTPIKHSTNTSTQTDATTNGEDDSLLDNLRSALSAATTLLEDFELDSDLVIVPRIWLEDAMRLLREETTRVT